MQSTDYLRNIPKTLPAVLAGFGILAVTGCHTPSGGPKPLPTTSDSTFSRLYDRKDDRALQAASDPATLLATHDRVKRREGIVKARLAETSDEDEEDDLKDELQILAYLDKRLTDARKGNPGRGTASLNLETERILNLMEDRGIGSGAPHNFAQLLTGMVPTALFGHRLPAPGLGGGDTVLTPRDAKRESALLYHMAEKRFYRKHELSSMTHNQVAALDVAPHHPAFFRSEDIPRDPIGDFEKAMEKGVQKSLIADGEIDSARKWDFTSSRRILFMDEVYKSATSAKAKTEDGHGVQWKIKWGDEVQPEAVSTRLYLLTGAKMTDLSFVGGGGPQEMVLILSKKGEYDPKDKNEREPADVAQLSEALDDFYGFDIAPYIHSHGVVSEANAGKLLGGLSKKKRSEMIGRNWVSFKEYSLELRPKGHLRTLDGVYLSDLVGSEDRGARGLYLFSLWLESKDSKDDNHKTYFTKNEKKSGGKKITEHFEGQHDLGVTLGAVGSAGRINVLKTGDQFLRMNRSGRAISGGDTFVYKPRAFYDATWADSKWMARRIVNLSDKNLRRAIISTKWPDFMQEVLFYKLAARRNQLARLYGIGARGNPAAPEISVDLSSPQKIRVAEERYGLSPGSLAEDIASRHGRNSPMYENLVSKGQVVSSDDSSLIRQLTIQRYPAGLSDRYRRLTNKNPKALRD